MLEEKDFITTEMKFKNLVPIFSKKKLHILALKPNKDLDYVNKLFEEGKIKPVIDGPYQLSEAPKIFNYFGEGKHTGKVIINLVHKDIIK